MNYKKNNNPSLLTRACTRTLTGEFAFLLSQVSHFIRKTLIISEIQTYIHRISQISNLPTSKRRIWAMQNTLTRPHFCLLSSLFRHHFIMSVTLVTAKNQHHCWKARAQHARVRLREKTSPSLLYLLRVLPQSVTPLVSRCREHCPKRYITMPAHRTKPQHTDS